jgi:selenocysteine-specific elongation factor
VTVHLGTADVPARVARAGPFGQLRLRSPVVAARGDRVILRARTTVGGGVVLDPDPPRRLDVRRLELLQQGNVAATVNAPVRLDSLRGLLDGEPEGLEHAGEWVFSRSWLDELRADLDEQLDAADALDPGVREPAEPWAPAIVPLLGLERRRAKLYRPGVVPDLGVRAQAAIELEARLGLEPVKVEDRELARFLEERGTLVRVGGGLAVSAQAYAEARRKLEEECRTTGSITLARYRDLLGVGRRTAQLLLERLDSDGVTRRVGDERVLRRSATRR